MIANFITQQATLLAAFPTDFLPLAANAAEGGPLAEAAEAVEVQDGGVEIVNGGDLVNGFVAKFIVSPWMGCLQLSCSACQFPEFAVRVDIDRRCAQNESMMGFFIILLLSISQLAFSQTTGKEEPVQDLEIARKYTVVSPVKFSKMRGPVKISENLYSLSLTVPPTFMGPPQFSGNPPVDPFAPDPESAPKKMPLKSAQKFLEDAGITFGPGTYARYIPGASVLTVVSTREKLFCQSKILAFKMAIRDSKMPMWISKMPICVFRMAIWVHKMAGQSLNCNSVEPNCHPWGPNCHPLKPNCHLI